jgi:hypothetical protein
LAELLAGLPISKRGDETFQHHERADAHKFLARCEGDHSMLYVLDQYALYEAQDPLRRLRPERPRQFWFDWPSSAAEATLALEKCVRHLLEYAAAGLAQPALLRSVQNVTDVLRRIIEDANSVAIDGAQEYHDPIVQENAMVLSALHYVKITKLAAVPLATAIPDLVKTVDLSSPPGITAYLELAERQVALTLLTDPRADNDDPRVREAVELVVAQLPDVFRASYAKYAAQLRSPTFKTLADLFSDANTVRALLGAAAYTPPSVSTTATRTTLSQRGARATATMAAMYDDEDAAAASAPAAATANEFWFCALDVAQRLKRGEADPRPRLNKLPTIDVYARAEGGAPILAVADTGCDFDGMVTDKAGLRTLRAAGIEAKDASRAVTLSSPMSGPKSAAIHNATLFRRRRAYDVAIAVVHEAFPTEMPSLFAGMPLLDRMDYHFARAGGQQRGGRGRSDGDRKDSNNGKKQNRPKRDGDATHGDVAPPAPA